MSWQEQTALRRIFNVFKRNRTNVYQEDINALDRKSTRLNSSHCGTSRMPSSA